VRGARSLRGVVLKLRGGVRERSSKSVRVGGWRGLVMALSQVR
jgi:hypothetical protein